MKKQLTLIKLPTVMVFLHVKHIIKCKISLPIIQLYLDGTVPQPSSSSSGGGGRSTLLKMYLSHGSLMMIGMGIIIIPSGAIIARFLKYPSKWIMVSIST
jgi:hypothetical protein